MSQNTLTVVVTGATGKQGGAVAQGLLARGHKVRAVTRNPNSKHAKLLADAGASLVTASLTTLRRSPGRSMERPLSSR